MMNSSFLHVQIIRKEVLYLESDSMATSIVFSTGFGAVVFTFVCLIFRRWAHFQARRLILADKVKYDAAWATVQGDKNHRHSVAALKIRLQSLMNRAAPAQSRHYNRVKKSISGRRPSSSSYDPKQTIPKPISTDLSDLQGPAALDVHRKAPVSRWEGLMDVGLPGQLDFSSPVNSLDQLYYQATALNPIMIKKIQFWAALSGGCFQVGARVSPPKLESSSHSIVFSSVTKEDCDGVVGTCPLERRRSTKHVDQIALTSREEQKGSPDQLPVGYVRWNDVKEEEGMLGSVVKWGTIKSVKRSIEKSTRSYGKVCPQTHCAYHMLLCCTLHGNFMLLVHQFCVTEHLE